MDQITLVAPRLADAVLVVAGSSHDFTCDRCAEAVVISPSSLEFIPLGLISQTWCVPCALEVAQELSEEVGAGEEPAT